MDQYKFNKKNGKPYIYQLDGDVSWDWIHKSHQGK